MSLNRSVENQPLLEAIDPIDGADLEEILVDADHALPVQGYVMLAGHPVPSDVLLLIAAHLSLQDYLSLSAVNHALHHSLSSQRITNSLYVRISDLDEPVTLFQVKSFLNGGFPEREQWSRLKHSESRCQTLDACCNSFGCEMTAIFMMAVSSVGGLAAAGVPVIIHMADAGYSENAIVFSAIAAGVTSGAALGLATYGLYAGCKRIVTRNIQSISARADDLDQHIANDPELRSKDAICKFFKSADRKNKDIQFYHHSNERIDLPLIQRMMG